MIAVIYARYSSELQRDASIEDQIRLCRRRIGQEGWEYRHAYTDRAQSGATALRPAYQSLLEDARRGEFDIVVAEGLDRLSRDQEDVAGILKRLRFAGVRLFTLAEGEIGELHVGLKGTMNALFLRDLAQKVRRGLEGRVREGRSGGGLCFGYQIVREYDGRGEPVHGGRTIYANEAAIVHRIFAELYRQRVDRLHEELNRSELRSEAAQALRGLIDEVRLAPENGRLEIELLGALAGILALAADSKKPATADRDGLQATLVAGEGFEPSTFRL
jgi:DNA invertase Pin-like site-specific DNA recombinase